MEGDVGISAEVKKKPLLSSQALGEKKVCGNVNQARLANATLLILRIGGPKPLL